LTHTELDTAGSHAHHITPLYSSTDNHYLNYTIHTTNLRAIHKQSNQPQVQTKLPLSTFTKQQKTLIAFNILTKNTELCEISHPKQY
jgi:hypothetical protein